MRRHTRTQRLPLEYFEAEEKGVLQAAPTEPYDIPGWSEPQVSRDRHVQVAKALYSLPKEFQGRKLVGRKLRARADRSTVRLYLDGILVKTHPRQPPGGRSTDPADFPAEKFAYANRDADFLGRQARQHGESVGRFADALLEGPLPWTRMRRVYSLLGMCKRYGSHRVEEVCAVALDADMLDVRRLERMLKLACHQPAPESSTPAKVIPLARYLRPKDQYTLPRGPARRKKEEDP
jgi:hypothetical protein